MKNVKFLFLSLVSVFTICYTSLQAQSFDEACAGAKVYYSISEALQQKDSVYKLDISMQKLTQIPSDITKLKQLQCLDLSFNRFSTLPAEFAQLKSLTYLNLSGTRFLSKLPEVLKQLPNLQVLDLRDHPEWTKTKFDEARKMLPKVNIITE